MSGTGLPAPGWPADWLNGWLAAVGVARATGLLLRFTVEPLPHPVFSSDAGTVSAREVAAAIPSLDDLSRSVIAREHPDSGSAFPRNPTLPQFEERARLARSSGDLMLGATVTDLVRDAASRLDHSPFDASVPRGLTIWDRVVLCRTAIGDDVESVVEQSLRGTLPRVKNNGLGFDARRIAVATATDSEKYVDPVVETCAFRALPLFPVGGAGGRSGTTRGWVTAPSRRGSFSWPVWSQPLSWEAIDALLDEFWLARQRARAVARFDAFDVGRWRTGVRALGVFGAYWSVPYQATGSADSTRAYSSEELWMTL